MEMDSKKQIFVVDALIRNAEGKFLIQKRYDPTVPDANGKWEFPGGGIDFGENPEDAVKREILEEIGCEVSVGRLLPCLVSHVWTLATGEKNHVIVFFYECTITKGVPRPGHDEVAEILWCTEEEIRKLDTLPDTNLVFEYL